MPSCAHQIQERKKISHIPQKCMYTLNITIKIVHMNMNSSGYNQKELTQYAYRNSELWLLFLFKPVISKQKLYTQWKIWEHNKTKNHFYFYFYFIFIYFFYLTFIILNYFLFFFFLYFFFFFLVDFFFYNFLFFLNYLEYFIF